MYAASVIIPVYNAEHTLRKCIESLYYGHEKNLEIILVDDCSIDNSWTLCKTLAQEYPNIQCYQNEKNSGVSFTRNYALSKATAPYVLFVDSDDWVSSSYASKLLQVNKENDGDLSLCGYTYIDHIANSRRIVLPNVAESKILFTKTAFSLFDRVLLQQLWNKVFRRDIIISHNIRFDESQSMGEDFQFVLDYMEAAQIKNCVVLNEPLYYYVRWNNTSLMNKFGFIDHQPEFDRINQLAKIIGPSSVTERDAKLAQIKQNYLYHIARNKTHSKQEKLEAIEQIKGDGQAASYYRQQRMQYAKEQISSQLHAAKQFVPRIQGRLKRSQINKKTSATVKQVDADGITFISQNCIGGVLYHDLGLPFLSPTINTFIPEPGFVKFTLNLHYYMEQEIEMHWGEEYPIGLLDDVEIHFMHYETCQEAKSAWIRRKARINWDKIFVICTDRDGFDTTIYEQWQQIPYPKILYTAHSEFTEDAVYFPEYAADGQVGDLISERDFYRDQLLLERINTYVC